MSFGYPYSGAKGSEPMNQEKKHYSFITKINILLIVLLCIGILATGGLYLYNRLGRSDDPAVTISDNVIGDPSGSESQSSSESESSDITDGSASDQSISSEQPASSAPSEPSESSEMSGTQREVESTSVSNTDPESIEMSFIDDVLSGSTGFTVKNIFPGDSVQNAYRIRFKHDKALKVTVSFEPYPESSVTLAKNLTIKVFLRESGTILFSSDLEELKSEAVYFYIKAANNDQSILTFDFEVSLPTTAGNDCAYRRVAGDLVWTAVETDSIPRDGHPVISPQTGDDSDLTLYAVIIVISLAVLILLLVKRRKRGCKDEE